MKFIVLLYIIVLLFFLSCNGGVKVLTPEQYQIWVKKSENKLVRIKEINGFRFTTKFKPNELLILQSPELLNSQSSIDSVMEIQRGVVNFVMDIGSIDGQQSLLRANIVSEEDYYQRLFYYTNEVQKDLYLVEGQDTLPCAFYHFEQTYNLSPVNSLIMEFQRKEASSAYKDLHLIYDDRVLNTGIMKFQFEKSFLNNLPQLKLL